MDTFLIDGQSVTFEPGENILQAALEADIQIPHFCYHAALGSLGACRLCAVEINPKDSDKNARVVMACLEPAQKGLEVSLSAAAAQQVRRHVIELLMINHPHDCPICDEGGECHLQEMTVACGPSYRRYRGNKRTFPNQDLGPLIHHEMNRCITCYRCTRFYQDYALGNDLGAMRLRNEVYFGRFQDGPLENPFAGNLVEICPTGVFTDAVFRQHFARTWDLKTAPSICPHCSVGCNTLPGARDGTLRRVRNRAHQELNRWFICDRGRYGHQYSEHNTRPLSPRVSGINTDYRSALAAAARKIQAAAERTGGIGSVREDLEGNVMLRSLLNDLKGIFTAFNDPELEAATLTAVSRMQELDNTPHLAALEQIDAALITGDLTVHAPMIDLALRQAWRNGAKLAMLHSSVAPLTQFASTAATVAPREIHDMLTQLYRQISRQPETNDAVTQTIKTIAATLSQARQPLMAGVVETSTAQDIIALAELAKAFEPAAQLIYVLPGPNAYGAALLSAAGDTVSLLKAVERGEVQTLIVAGSDPFSEPRSGARWRVARQKINTLIVLDCIATATAEAADILIPVAAWPERSGTFVNYEGRAQGFSTVFHRPEYLPSTADIISEISRLLENQLCDAASMLQDSFPGFQAPTPGTPGVQISAQHLPIRNNELMQTEPYSSDNGWQAALTSWLGDEPLAGFSPALTELAPPDTALINPESAARASLKSGSSVRLWNSVYSVETCVQINPSVANETIAIPRSMLVRLGIGHGDSLNLEQLV
ncbi:NADH dehydrogenase subunit G [Nitrosomonas marina]|uniref:NADH-quinone oxidoreductase n=1 Tax=Nitrosomonas marina TaxID=917 RepID=A0A1H9ZXN6_9PROT|nr:NADH-quinone oxidoreductase subunit NuoG [Nitrosomonas marina]SES86548.1 NADH dehydrogenase subunit G [Nitrosomonas marina]